MRPVIETKQNIDMKSWNIINTYLYNSHLQHLFYIKIRFEKRFS